MDVIETKDIRYFIKFITECREIKKSLLIVGKSSNFDFDAFECNLDSWSIGREIDEDYMNRMIDEFGKRKIVFLYDVELPLKYIRCIKPSIIVTFKSKIDTCYKCNKKIEYLKGNQEYNLYHCGCTNTTYNDCFGKVPESIKLTTLKNMIKEVQNIFSKMLNIIDDQND